MPPSTRVLTLITPLWAPSSGLLDQTCASVRDQVLPDGWSLEWMLQEDGPDPSMADRVAGLDVGAATVRYAANGHGFGPAVSRNHALARSTGELVACVDHDDLLLPGALAALVTALEEHPDAAWAVGASMLDYGTGTPGLRDDTLPLGPAAPGEVYRRWLQTDGYPPVYPTSTMYRPQALWTLGGWPAVGRAEDLVLLFAVSQCHPGVVVDHPTHVRRMWEAQATAAPWSADLRESTYGLRRRHLAALGAPVDGPYPDGSTPPDRLAPT